MEKESAMDMVGDPAPDFTLKDIKTGEEIRLSQIKQPVVLLFWSTWAMNSETAFERFEAFYQRNKGRVVVIGVCVENQTMSDADVINIKEFVRKQKASFPIVLDKKLQTFHDYRIVAIPTSVLVRNGNVKYALTGFPYGGVEDMFDYFKDFVKSLFH